MPKIGIPCESIRYSSTKNDHQHFPITSQYKYIKIFMKEYFHLILTNQYFKVYFIGAKKVLLNTNVYFSEIQ